MFQQIINKKKKGLTLKRALSNSLIFYEQDDSKYNLTKQQEVTSNISM